MLRCGMVLPFVLSLFALALGVPLGGMLDVGAFSRASAGGPLPEGWRPLAFRKVARHTRYELVEDEGVVVVKATSERSASGLVRAIRIDPKRDPVVAWRWKVMNVIERANVRTKAGDDYPARVYVTFEYDSRRVGLLERSKFEAARLWYGEYPPLHALDYVWEGREPAGTMLPNPYSDRVEMIVVESGPEKLGRWVEERRDVAADYRLAFGEDPPAISGVAIMTDTDDTESSATAYYGDVVFRER